MEDLFFILAVICSGIALVFGFRGLMGKGRDRSNWKGWIIAITLYVVFMAVAFAIRG